MNYQEIFETMNDMLDSAAAIPLSGKCLINGDRMRDLINALQESLPQELAQANRILAEKDRIIETAKKDAEDKVKLAEEHARRIVDEDEITKKIKERANDMMKMATTQSKELKVAANGYADSILQNTEQSLVESLNQLRAAKAALRANPTTAPAGEEK